MYILGWIIAVLSILVGSYFLVYKKNMIGIPFTSSPTPIVEEVVDIKAGFAIFTNGTFRVFTASMYHNLSEDVYIASSNPNIVRVKEKAITWDDFFQTLPMTLTKDCLRTGTKEVFCTSTEGKLRFYLNKQEDPELLGKEIKNGDQALISFGNDDKEIEGQFKKIPTP